MKQKYSKLLDSNNLLQETVNRLQRELNDIAEERENLLSKLTDSPVSKIINRYKFLISDFKTSFTSTFYYVVHFYI